MIHYSAADLKGKELYKLLSGIVIPRPIAWVATWTTEYHQINLAPFSFFNVVSSDIPLISLAIQRKGGKQKDTAQNILDTKEAVIHFVDEELVEPMNQTAISLARQESELNQLNVTLVESTSVSVPSIGEAKIRMEASLYQHIPIAGLEKGTTITDLFLLKIEEFHFEDWVIDQDNLYILSEKLQAVSRLAGNEYATTGDIFKLERPN